MHLVRTSSTTRHVLLPLELSLACVWLLTGVICIAGTDEAMSLIERVGVAVTAGLWIIRLTAGFEILLGLAVLAGFWPRLLAIVQIVLIAGFTAIISVFLPGFWLHPFGPVSKNVVLIAAAYVTCRLGENHEKKSWT